MISQLLKKWFVKKTVKKKTVLENLADEFDALDLSGRSDIFSSDKSNVRVTVSVRTIESYIKLLKIVHDSFVNELQLNKSQTLHEVETIYLRDFFEDRKGHHQDPVKALLEFVPLCSAVLRRYSEIDEKIEKSFTEQSNLRLSSGLVTNLVSILDTLKSL